MLRLIFNKRDHSTELYEYILQGPSHGVYWFYITNPGDDCVDDMAYFYSFNENFILI